MRSSHRTDRLAVWSYTENGEQIACGDPSVTDRQRAAAGRETLAERSRALIVENRNRAHERYASGPSPADDEATRIWFPRDPEVLRSRVDQEALAVWAEEETLHILWNGHADQVGLGGGVQPNLWPVPGADDLWEASLRIRRLDQSVISIIVLARQGDDLPFGAAASDMTIWRGPKAPHVPAVPESLIGTLEEHTIDGGTLAAARGLTVYRPPAEGPLPACIVADGEAVPGFAGFLEPAVLAGTAPAVLLIGVHSGLDRGRAAADGRAREYLPGQDRRRFAAHLRFVTDDVIPWAAERWPLQSRPWLAAGFSNGAAWAIGAAQRRPDVFGAVAALSPGVVPSRITAAARAASIRHYLAGGTLEPGFRRATQNWADRLQRARQPFHHHEWIGGHDNWWWQQQLPVALDWLLRP